jgi:hypothetical protein
MINEAMVLGVDDVHAVPVGKCEVYHVCPSTQHCWLARESLLGIEARNKPQNRSIVVYSTLANLIL